MKKIITLSVLLVGIMLVAGCVQQKTSKNKSVNQDTFVKLNDSKYFNMEFYYPEGYKKETPYEGIFTVVSNDFHSSSVLGIPKMDRGAQIDLKTAPILGDTSITQQEWIKQKPNEISVIMNTTQGLVDGIPVVIYEVKPEQDKIAPYNYIKGIIFLNQKDKNEVVLELSAFSEDKNGFEVYKSAFDKMVSTIKLNP